jgi:DNA-binding XRE family transcriptional regulator
LLNNIIKDRIILLLINLVVFDKVPIKTGCFNMTKRDIAGYLGVDTKTLYNWEKFKPNLYKTVMLGLAFKDAISKSKQNYEELEELAQSLDTKTIKAK